jgi:hypothetical protein
MGIINTKKIIHTKNGITQNYKGIWRTNDQTSWCKLQAYPLNLITDKAQIEEI